MTITMNLHVVLRLFLAAVCVLPAVCFAQSEETGPEGKSAFLVTYGPSGITSLHCAGDDRKIKFIRPGACLGDVHIMYRSKEDARRAVLTGKLAASRTTGDFTTFLFDLGSRLFLTEKFSCEKGALLWSLTLHNRGEKTIEIGDLALSLPMRTDYPHGFEKDEVKQEIFERRLIRHSFISGHGSFLFWIPVGGGGPQLVMMPEKGTACEYFTEAHSNYAHGGGWYRVFIHSAATAAGTKRGTWRQKHTKCTLAPGERRTYGFRFLWADGYEAIRALLYQNDLFDIRVAPGMVIPHNLDVHLGIRTRNTITDVRAEFPRRTVIQQEGVKSGRVHLYTIRFSRLGENAITVECAGGRHMLLEFFVTQPLETLIKKRAHFITEKQQHRNPEKWYDGLFSLWDVRMQEGCNLLGPENLGGQHPYAVSGSDDPSNSKCIFLSEKNVVYPDAKEIEALEYFIGRFVWGKHQRTGKDTPYPYGIYGADSWHVNRFAKRDMLEGAVSRPGGPSQCRMWRTFDYTTYFALYYNMFRIAVRQPGLVKYLDADGYLERAFGTAKAYFEVPYNIRMEGGWSFSGWTDWAYTIGNFHEKYVLKIIDALKKRGEEEKAAYLTDRWERKVKYFIYDDRFPFISEMPVDSTAYESSYAIARYALTRGLQPDTNLWKDKNTGKWYSHPVIDPQRHRSFLKRQLRANLACRGCLETSYYHYGSDFRGCGSSSYTLSYMSQMGGWAILDQAIRFEKEPAELVRLGWGAMLSSWALVNAGTEDSDYGWWSPGRLHDGAAGWGFFPQQLGDDWNPATRGIARGAWPVDGEIDHGLTAYVETATTCVVEDPWFGLIAYGGEVERKGEALEIIPRDGVRRRLAAVLESKRFRVALERDGFVRDEPVLIDEKTGSIAFMLENRSAEQHTTRCMLSGFPAGSCAVTIDGERAECKVSVSGKSTVIPLPLGRKRRHRIVIGWEDAKHASAGEKRSSATRKK